MRILLLGDIAVDRQFERLERVVPIFHDADLVVANLEGPIVPEQHEALLASAKRPVLYSAPDVLGVLSAFNVGAACLANNHMFDLPLPVAETTSVLAAAGIGCFGAGASLAEASEPLAIRANQTTIKLFGFGWEVIGCQPAGVRREGVNPLTAAHVLDTIRSLRAEDTASFVIFVMHWNYELERYPAPAHRQLAHDLIREGVDAVIGLHPHVAQGAERVEGRPIVYSLGNWFLPPRQMRNFRLSFPDIARRQLVFELGVEGRMVHAMRLHWYDFDPDTCAITPVQTEDFGGSIVQSLTAFAGMSHSSYVSWFKTHRTRRRGLPVYADYRRRLNNRAKDYFVRARQAGINSLVQLGLKRDLSA
jgi:hypothetical protein